MSREFVTPEFLQNGTADEWHEVAKSALPKNIDMSDGNHAWNLTRGPALIAARMCEFILPEVIKVIFPSWSYGTYLDEHAKVRRMSRRAATAAAGKITITGIANTVIPAGSQFSTATVNNEPSVTYKTLEEARIPKTGSVVVPVQCTETGVVGNTGINTIIFVASRVSGITGVTNEEEITGGTEIETDESLIERTEEYDANLDYMFVGCPADYRRWAMSVPGVGNATIVSAQDDSGLVTIIITDTNGDPATQVLCKDVYNFIMRPDAPNERLAPINAFLSVIPPNTVSIGIKAVIELEEGYTLEIAQSALMEKLVAYLPIALMEEEIKLSEIAAAINDTVGIADFDIFGLRVGMEQDGSIEYGTDNIPLDADQLPTIKEENLLLSIAK